jgi:sporulation protein YlmC with PRC-barrel domain
MPQSNILYGKNVLGNRVKNKAGEELGKVEDLIIDPVTNRIAYVILSFGGFLGVGDKLYPAPLNALTLDTVSKEFILDMDKERLKSAPGFDKDKYPDLTDQKWGSGVYKFYGYKPYWDRDYTESARFRSIESD